MTTKAWLQSIVTAFISAFSTGAVGALALPTVFNFSHDGIWNLAKLTLVPALINVFTFLKQSPLPSDSQTATISVTKQVLPVLLFLVLVGGLAGCSSFERDAFNTLAASQAVINQAQIDYNAKKIPQSKCAYALINDAKAAQTAGVEAMIVYEQEKSAKASLTAQTATVTADLAALPALVARIKSLSINPAGCAAPAVGAVS